jgi:hypothetical protein
MDGRRYATKRVAAMLKMRQPHLQRAIKAGRVVAPPLIRLGPLKVRLWTKTEVEQARKALGRDEKKEKV